MPEPTMKSPEQLFEGDVVVFAGKRMRVLWEPIKLVDEERGKWDVTLVPEEPDETLEAIKHFSRSKDVDQVVLTIHQDFQLEVEAVPTVICEGAEGVPDKDGMPTWDCPVCNDYFTADQLRSEDGATHLLPEHLRREEQT